MVSVSLSTLKCPACSEQTLETLSAPIGSMERCPQCRGLFIAQELVAAASSEREKCIQAIEETNALLLPTERSCPKCLQKLYDGRVKSRGVIFTLCTTCQSLWTSLSVLQQFEEAVERTIHLQIDIATSAGAGDTGPIKKSFGHDAFSYEDSAAGRFFRGFARFFDSWADKFSRSPRSTPEKKSKPAKPSKITKPAPLVQAVEPILPEIPAASVKQNQPPKPVKADPLPPPQELPKEPEPLSVAPSIEIPEFIFPDEPAVEEKPAPPPEPLVLEPIPKPQPEPEPTPQTVPEPAPKPEPLPPVPAPVPYELVRIEPFFAEAPAKPLQEAVTEPVPTPEPAAAPPEKTGLLGSLKSAWNPAAKKSGSSATPSSIKQGLPAAKPIDVPQPKPAVGLGEKFAAFWKPKPRIKAAKPAIPKPAKPIVPAQAPKLDSPPVLKAPAPLSKLPKPKGEGFFATIFKPRPKKPAVTPAPVPVQPVSPSRPAEPVQPVQPAAAAKAAKPVLPVKPAVKPVKPPRPQRIKIPRDRMDAVAVWPPWALAVLGGGLSAFRDFGFEAVPALLWSLAGWSIGFMVRLARLYPFIPFEESTLGALVERSAALGTRGIPVILKGEIIPAREEDPKGEVVFRQEDKTLSLNRIATWDLLPRLFALSNPRQLPRGEVILKGWYRGGLAPFLDVQEVKMGKTRRQSMVRSLRWTSAILLLIVVMVIYFSLE